MNEEGQAGAVEGGHGDEGEGEEKEVEIEEDAEENGGQFAEARAIGGDEAGGVADLFGGVKPTEGEAEANKEGGDEADEEVGGRPGQGHESGATGVAPGPFGIVGRAGPTDHPAAHDVGEDGDNDHAEGFAADVGNGIECDLAATMGGGVAQLQGDKGMAGFVQGGG